MAGKDTRKKRIHASKSQLAILESSFQACPKPTSKARKVISEKVHLNERCVQIWFQNRRARQKKMLALEQQNTDGGMDGNGSASDSPMTPRTPTAGAAAAASSLVPQPNDAGLMYCETFKASSIAIGTWRRISMTQGDLICALDPVRRTLRWMVVESTYGFQMEVPLFSILDVSVGRHTANVAILTIDIATQPAFSKE
ncbi:Homeodomain-like protein, partial [Chytridium lagenaria]